MKLAIIFATSLVGVASAQDLTPEQTFQINCSACHAVDRKLVGPSLVEILDIYENDPDGFVQWSLAPKHKRENLIQMPSMAHLGEDTLRQIYSYVSTTAEGKTEVQVRNADPFPVPVGYLRRPQMQRIFMPDASPAAIAVALPGSLSYCFDASVCRLRYVWQGGFIDGWPYWQSSGNGLARIQGDVVYTEPGYPLTWSTADKELPTKFLGYKLDETGIPTFQYRLGDDKWSETIRPLPDGSGITREFTTEANTTMTAVVPEGIKVESSTGNLEINTAESKSFTLTYRWK